MTFDQAVAQILAIIDGAQPPAPPAIAVDSIATKSPKNKGARRKARGDKSSLPAGPDAAAAAPAPGAKKISAAPAPPAVADENLDRTLTACALLDKSDTDNGKRLIAYFGSDIVVRAESEVAAGTFLNWTGTHWDLDGGAAEIMKLAQRVGDLIMREAAFLPATKSEEKAIAAGKQAAEELKTLKTVPEAEWDDDRKQAAWALEVIVKEGAAAYTRWTSRKRKHYGLGVSAKNAGKIHSMLDCAGPHLRRPPDAFNTDPLKIATARHTLRFRRELSAETTDHQEKWDASLEVIEGHCREDYITACIPVVYDADATIDKFKNFIEWAIPDAASRRTLQQFCGLSLMNIPTQRFMVHYGEKGANGKSTFLEVLFRLFGPSFAVGLGQESIAGNGQRSAGQAQPDIARLYGKRFLRVTELKKGVPLQEDVIKRLTGGESLPSRTLFKGYFEFVPTVKPHFSCNGYPGIDGDASAMWRRALIMEYPNTLAEHEQRDFDLVVNELLAEGAGILNWLIAGALDYLRHGLVVAPAVRASGQAYRDEMDTVGVFHRACVETRAGERVQANRMYQAYLGWCHANARTPKKETSFGRQMKKLQAHDDGGAKHFYVDCVLKDVPELPADDPRARHYAPESGQPPPLQKGKDDEIKF